MLTFQLLVVFDGDAYLSVGVTVLSHVCPDCIPADLFVRRM